MNQQFPSPTLQAQPTTGTSTHLKGMAMVLTGAVLWGLSGTAAQVLFQHKGISPLWLVNVRMGISGILLVLLVIGRQGITDALQIFKHAKDLVRLLLFSLFGLIGVQYSYFAAIHYGNAAMATLLQNLGPAILTIYLALGQRKLPEKRWLLAVVIAFLGTFMLVTGGKFNGLQISMTALIWGLVSAVTLAFYTVFPEKMIHKYGTATVVGWAMVIGGLILSVVDQPWRTHVHFTVSSLSLIAFVVIFGTFVAFYLYLASIKLISPAETSLLASAEPLTATIVSIAFLHIHLTMTSMIGGFLIVLMVILLASKPKSVRKERG